MGGRRSCFFEEAEAEAEVEAEAEAVLSCCCVVCDTMSPLLPRSDATAARSAATSEGTAPSPVICAGLSVGKMECPTIESRERNEGSGEGM